MLEKILAPTACNVAIIDGMNRAVMIARQAHRTLVVVLPDGRCSVDIFDRTYCRATATASADVRVDSKLLVSNHLAIEVAADDVGIESGSGAALQFYDAALAVFDDSADVCELPTGILHFFCYALVAVGMHERQTDIRLWHDDRELCLSRQTMQCQLFIENGHRFSHVVATGRDSIAVGGRLQLVVGCRARALEDSTTDKFANDMRRLPAMSGKAETQSLVFLQLIVQRVFLQLIGDEI